MTTATVLRRNQNSATANNDVHDEILFTNKIGNNTEEIEMSIAEDGIGFLLDLLSDLSVNRGAYAIREAYSNAYDATLATGDMTRPIEITLPFMSNGPRNLMTKLGYDNTTVQTAVIRDYGIGMSPDDVKKYFTQYGGSKKRGNGDVASIGSKGLGSKAPLACSDAFTVITVKDGVKTHALIERTNNRNQATITVEDTDMENGTEIRIPITDMQVAQQMKDCVDNIVKWNLDANIILNGNPTTPELSTELNSEAISSSQRRYYNDSSNYIYMGYVPVGVDENGNPVMFRMWQRLDVFPTMRVEDGIGLNLAGVHYPLSNSNYDTPVLIVAGDPGYLNFTPSRDEVKNDHAKIEFVEAVQNAIHDFDFAPIVENLFNVMSIAQKKSWIANHRYETTIDRDNNTFTLSPVLNKSWFGTKNLPEAKNLPLSLLVHEDGTDMSELFRTDEADIVSGDITNTYSIFSFQGHSNGRFNVYNEKYGNSLLSSQIRKSQAYECRTEHTLRCLFSYLNDYYRYATFSKIMIVLGMKTEENYKDFAKWEKNLRDAYGLELANVLYLFTESDTDTRTVLEQHVFDGHSLEVITLEDAIEKARKARSSRSAGTRTTASDLMDSLRERPNQPIAYSIYKNEHYNPFFDKEQHKTIVANTVLPLFSLNTINDIDELIKDTVFVLSNGMSNATRDEVIEIINGLVATGNLPQNMNRIVIFEDILAGDAKKLEKAGAVFFADFRTHVKHKVTNILDTTDGITSIGDTHFSVEAKLIFPDYNEMTDEMICQFIVNNISDLKSHLRELNLMVELIDDKYITNDVKKIVHKIIDTYTNFHFSANYSLITLTYGIGANARVKEIAETLQQLMGMWGEIFGTLEANTFYRRSWSVSDFELLSNVKDLLAPGVNAFMEKHTEKTDDVLPFRIAA